MGGLYQAQRDMRLRPAGGFEAQAGAGPIKGGGRKKKIATFNEELVRTRTRFSVFDAWYSQLSEAGALGTFDEWSADVRDALAVGDTVEFEAELVISPVHKLFRTYISFAETPRSPEVCSSSKAKNLPRRSRPLGCFLRGRAVATNRRTFPCTSASTAAGFHERHRSDPCRDPSNPAPAWAQNVGQYGTTFHWLDLRRAYRKISAASSATPCNRRRDPEDS
jgi:hypothetical protein